MKNKHIFDIEELFDVDEVQGHLVTFVNPFSWLEVLKISNTISSFKIFADGISVVVLYNLFMGKKIRRYAFDNTSVAPIVFDYAVKNNKSVFFLGGREGIAQQAAAMFQGAHPGLVVSGTAPGYFDNHFHRERVLDSATKADIVIAGMGAPFQELMLNELRNRGWSGTGYTCGGFFDQTVRKGLTYFPKGIDRLHLRWLYRLWDEPGRLSKRYLITYPAFLFTFLFLLMSSPFRK